MKATDIFVNLPGKDLKRSVAFFTALGAEFNPQFTNDSATCMVLSEHIHVMLLVEPFFKSFLTKPMADAHQVTEVLTCFGVRDRAEVDALLQRALAAGANEPRPAPDHGWMVSRCFEDLDGHVWEVMHADPSQMPAG